MASFSSSNTANNDPTVVSVVDITQIASTSVAGRKSNDDVLAELVKLSSDEESSEIDLGLMMEMEMEDEEEEMEDSDDDDDDEEEESDHEDDEE